MKVGRWVFDAVLADKLGGFFDAGQQRGLLLRAQVAAPDTDQAAAAVDGFDYQLLDIGGHELQVAGVAAPVVFTEARRGSRPSRPADFRQVFEQDGVFQHAGPRGSPSPRGRCMTSSRPGTPCGSRCAIPPDRTAGRRPGRRSTIDRVSPSSDFIHRKPLRTTRSPLCTSGRPR